MGKDLSNRGNVHQGISHTWHCASTETTSCLHFLSFAYSTKKAKKLVVGGLNTNWEDPLEPERGRHTKSGNNKRSSRGVSNSSTGSAVSSNYIGLSDTSPVPPLDEDDGIHQATFAESDTDEQPPKSATSRHSLKETHHSSTKGKTCMYLYTARYQ